MRLKEDDSSWRARGIKRRDFRHDPGTPETEIPPHKSKRKRRRHVKGCEHDFQLVLRHRWYKTYICNNCGKRSYVWESRWVITTGSSPVDKSQSLAGSVWQIVERDKS